MADQAQTLRELMRERSEHEDVQSGPRTFQFVGARAGVGTTTLAANLSAIFARSGWRVAAVDLDSVEKRADTPVNLAIALGAEPGLSRDMFSQVEEGLWLVSPRKDAAPEGPDAADLVFLDRGGMQSATASVRALKGETVIVLTPDPKDLAPVTEQLRNRREGLSKKLLAVGIIVNRARDGAEAQKVFRTLKSELERVPDLKVEYLGHCGHDEKIFQAVRKRKILLDLDSGAPSVRCFELLAKRFRARYLEDAGVEDDRIVARRKLQASRFREEPARSAPGNGTGFWRTLLGEVKA